MFKENMLKAQMVLKSVTTKELCKALDINESTFYRKMKKDGNFYRKEIAIIIRVLEIENPADIFFAEISA